MTIDEFRTQERLRTIARIRSEMKRAKHTGRRMTDLEQRLNEAADGVDGVIYADRNPDGQYIGITIIERSE